MKNIIFSFLMLSGLYTTAQKNYEPVDTRRKNESFAKFPKGEIRADLATFTFNGVDESVGKEQIQKDPVQYVWKQLYEL